VAATMMTSSLAFSDCVDLETGIGEGPVWDARLTRTGVRVAEGSNPCFLLSCVGTLLQRAVFLQPALSCNPFCLANACLIEYSECTQCL